MHYIDYSLEDFVLDPQFRKWVLENDAKAHAFWSEFAIKHPDKIELMKQARKVLLSLPEANYQISDEKVDVLWDSIEKHINESKGKSEHSSKVVSLNAATVLNQYTSSSSTNFWWLKVASILFLAFGISFILSRQMQVSPQLPVVENNQFVVKSNDWKYRPRFSLSDGTEVMLNGGSTISYYEKFASDKREVYLEGEAYFKVAKDVNRPFTVISKNLTTTALGTEFNVRAYGNDEEAVTLVSGMVKVGKVNDHRKNEMIILRPGQGATLGNSNKEISTFKFDELEYVAWMEGKLYLKNASEEEVLKRLSQWYGVTFTVINKSPKVWSYTGLFTSQYLENVLTSISFAMKFDFEIKDKEVEINYRDL